MSSAFTHYLMPKIEVMAENEVSELLESLKFSKEDLPLIDLSDAGLKGFEVKPGDIVRITRDEKKKIYYYRLVVD